MLNVILVVAAILVVAILAVLAIALTKPDRFEVIRSTTIDAPAENIYPLIADLHGWHTWSPFEKDPAMKRTFSGPPSGEGAAYAWDGNNSVGAGKMEIIEATTPSKIAIKLDFIRPFEGHNVAEFLLTPDSGGAQAGGTNVTWRMYGPAPLMNKVMQVFLNLDTMIGKDFERGLASLKTLAEKH